MSNHHQQILLDITKVGAVATAATTIKLIDINVYLTTISVVLAISYTLWKWCTDYKNQ